MRFMSGGLRAATLGGSARFNPLSLSPFIWLDPSDLSTLFQTDDESTPVTADGQTVGLMLDKSGNGRHLTQATAGSRPLYKTSSGLHWLEGDGTDDFLSVAYTIAQPWVRISAIRQIAWAGDDQVFGGVTANAGALYMDSAEPRLSIFSGNVLTGSTAAAVGADAIVTERHNGASSRIRINRETYITGDAGTTAPGGLTLLAASGGSTNANARCSGVILCDRDLTDAEVEAAEAWLAGKAGVTL